MIWLNYSRDPNLVKSAVENPEVIRLISEAGPEEIQEIREELEKRNRQAEIREYNRSFGHAVQEMFGLAPFWWVPYQ